MLQEYCTGPDRNLSEIFKFFLVYTLSFYIYYWKCMKFNNDFFWLLEIIRTSIYKWQLVVLKHFSAWIINYIFIWPYSFSSNELSIICVLYSPNNTKFLTLFLSIFIHILFQNKHSSKYHNYFKLSCD